MVHAPLPLVEEYVIVVHILIHWLILWLWVAHSRQILPLIVGVVFPHRQRGVHYSLALDYTLNIWKECEFCKDNQLHSYTDQSCHPCEALRMQ